jgi:hypothetical protein
VISTILVEELVEILVGNKKKHLPFDVKGVFVI